MYGNTRVAHWVLLALAVGCCLPAPVKAGPPQEKKSMLTPLFDVPSEGALVAISPDGKIVVTGRAGLLALRNASSVGEEIEVDLRAADRVRFSTDGRWVFAGPEVIDARTGRPKPDAPSLEEVFGRPEYAEFAVTAVEPSADGRTWAVLLVPAPERGTGAPDAPGVAQLVLVDVEKRPKITRTVPSTESGLNRVAASEHLLAGGGLGVMSGWDGAASRRLDGERMVRALRFGSGPLEGAILAGDAAGRLRILLAGGTVPLERSLHKGPVLTLAQSGDRIWTGGEDGSLHAVTVTAQITPLFHRRFDGEVEGVAVSSDGHTLAVAVAEGEPRVYVFQVGE